MSRATGTSGVAVSAEVQDRVADRVRHARELLAVTVARREREVLRLTETGDPDDALVARTFTDVLLVEEQSGQTWRAKTSSSLRSALSGARRACSSTPS